MISHQFLVRIPLGIDRIQQPLPRVKPDFNVRPSALSEFIARGAESRVQVSSNVTDQLKLQRERELIAQLQGR